MDADGNNHRTGKKVPRSSQFVSTKPNMVHAPARRKTAADALKEPLVAPGPALPSAAVTTASLHTKKSRLNELRARADAKEPESFDDQARALES